MAKIRTHERLPDTTGAWDPATRKGALSAISYSMPPPIPESGGPYKHPALPAPGTETSNEQLSIEFPRTRAQQEAYFDEVAGNPYGI